MPFPKRAWLLAPKATKSPWTVTTAVCCQPQPPDLGHCGVGTWPCTSPHWNSLWFRTRGPASPRYQHRVAVAARDLSKRIPPSIENSVG